MSVSVRARMKKKMSPNDTNNTNTEVQGNQILHDETQQNKEPDVSEWYKHNEETNVSE